MGNIEDEIERLRQKMQPEQEKVAGVSRRKLSDSCFKAVSAARFRKVKFLMDNGVAAGTRNDNGQNLLVAALHIPDPLKRRQMVWYLLSRGVPCSGLDDKGRDVLSWACILGIPEQLQQIANAALGNVDLHRKDKEGMTPLHHAVRHGQISIVRILINMMNKFRLSVDVQDIHGLTPYLYAKRLGHHDIADLLIKQGGASKKQFDSQSFHSGDDWAIIGAKEREEHKRNAKKQKLALYKIRGRLPPMQHKMVVPRLQLPDDHDHMFDGEGIATDGGGFTGRSVDTALTLLRLHPAAQIITTTGSNVKVTGNDTTSITSSSDMHSIRHGNLTCRDTIPTIMDILADQRSVSYRAQAKVPVKPDVSRRQMMRSRLSTLAILKASNNPKGDAIRGRRKQSVVPSLQGN